MANNLERLRQIAKSRATSIGKPNRAEKAVKEVLRYRARLAKKRRFGFPMSDLAARVNELDRIAEMAGKTTDIITGIRRQQAS